MHKKNQKKLHIAVKKMLKKFIVFVIYRVILTPGFKKKHMKIASNILNRSTEIFDTNRWVSAEIAILVYIFS